MKARGQTLNQIMRLIVKTPEQEAKAIKNKRQRYPSGKYNGKRMSRHRGIAEKALGRPLPPGVVVHHVDLNNKNYENTNLVICPNEEYHRLLHKRTELLLEKEMYLSLLVT